MTRATSQPYLGFGPDDGVPPADAPSTELLRAVRLAAKCFDIARSSKFRGERDAAISRGIAIAKKAGLRLELFDIPGRDEYHLQNALRDVDEARRRWAAELHADDGESIYDAKRRAFDEATTAAAERDRVAGRRSAGAPDLGEIRRADLLDRWPSVGSALNGLRARRVEIYPIDLPPTTKWSVPNRTPPIIDEWQLRELADEVCS